MAYDKVVDSSVLNASLKSIADAIREKAGSSDNLAFPAGFVEAIAGIEVGEIPNFGHNIDSGSFVLTSDKTGAEYNIETNLQKVRFGFIVCPELFEEKSVNHIMAACHVASDNGLGETTTKRFSVAMLAYGSFYSSSLIYGSTSLALNNELNFYLQKYYKAGYTYYWIAWGD